MVLTKQSMKLPKSTKTFLTPFDCTERRKDANIETNFKIQAVLDHWFSKSSNRARINPHKTFSKPFYILIFRDEKYSLLPVCKNEWQQNILEENVHLFFQRLFVFWQNVLTEISCGIILILCYCIISCK